MDCSPSERWQWLGAALGYRARPQPSKELRRLSTSHKKPSPTFSWRRSRRSWYASAACLFMLIVPPALTVFSWIALHYFGGSLSSALHALGTDGFSLFCERYAPSANWRTSILYFSWISFQAVLYTVLPGRSTGQLTHGGNLLEYRTNGFRAWQLTVAVAVGATIFGIVDPAAVAHHWEGAVVAFNIYGYALAMVAYWKAHYAPSYIEDRSFSGSALYDFLMGIEFNPRFGKDWDWKLFHNGRPGIIGWTLIDLSYTAWQYEKHGYITNSIILVDMLHALYVIDFFINESWYLRTIDICHDHFGFYLAWGSAAWLPTMYTLQVQYLARQPVQLSALAFVFILCMGVGGYTLFRSVNYQKDLVRRTKGDCDIWGKKARVMRCSFKTTDGRTHETLLLLSGWWGISRHANYVGDLLLSYAMCCACGFSHLLPWTYAIFMTIILVHRCFRDEQRCSAKYGDQWALYCKQVRWRLIPGIW